MAWVRFTSDWKWRVPGVPRLMKLGFRAGASVSVKAACANAAVAAGVAERIPAPSRRGRAGKGGDHGADTDPG